MADAITWTKGGQEYWCGTDFQKIRIFNFVGPNREKLTAYCCNMNLDLDGEPQAYAPLSKPQLRPKDGLRNAGWKDADGNAANKAAVEAGKIALAELEKQRAEYVAKKEAAAAAATGTPATGVPAPGAGSAAPPPPVPAPAGGTKPPTVAPKPAAKPPVDPELKKLDENIAKKKEAIRQLDFEHTDELDNHGPGIANPKNFGTIFWKWYGVHAMTPAQARNARPHLEMSASKLTLRKPVLDTTAIYEDVFGRFPVVQSIFEPGTDYFVSPIPHETNPKYPLWDQRCYIPNDLGVQTAFGALSTFLMADRTELNKGDKVFAMRLDTTDTLEFPFRDVGKGLKVAECSFAAFTGLGGVYHPELNGAAKYPNNFLLLYLAFPKKKSPREVLDIFATAPNADEFPVMLSFIAQATVDAQTVHSKVITADPMANFNNWKRATVKIMPPMLGTVIQGLGQAGSTFVQNMMRKHGSILGGNGSQLTAPTFP
jgi:hypothetical protein